jgi:hypothetical protein
VGATRKITVHVPEDLLDKARESTGRGTTETVRRGLELLAASAAYLKLRRLRGKVEVSVDLEALREDREGR